MDNDENIFRIKKYIEEMYCFEVSDIEKVKKSYKIKSKDRTYCLKIIEYGFEHFKFILGAMKHLKKNNFNDIPRFILNKNSSEYGVVNGKYAYLTEWIESRTSNYNNPIELSMVTTKLAELHKCSENFNIEKGMKPRIGWFSWQEVFNTRLNEILDFKNRISQKAYKSDFDKLYLENINTEIDRGRRSIDGLIKNNYIDIMEKEVFKRGFCHHDYAHHNVLIDKMEKVKIIDFDYCMLDSHLHDLSSLIIRCMKDGKWSEKKGNIIFYSYEKVKEVNKYELPIMREFIRFPQAFWQIGLQAYWELQPWDDDVFMSRLSKYLIDRKAREEFIDDYF